MRARSNCPSTAKLSKRALANILTANILYIPLS